MKKHSPKNKEGSGVIQNPRSFLCVRIILAMNNTNTPNSKPEQAVLLMLIQDYLDICDPVLTFDRFIVGIDLEKYLKKNRTSTSQI